MPSGAFVAELAYAEAPAAACAIGTHAVVQKCTNELGAAGGSGLAGAAQGQGASAWAASM